MSSKVMVTGASGWLGQKLVARLASQKKNIIFVDTWKDKPRIHENLMDYKRLKFVNGDIRKPEKFAREFEECETVFNCAAIIHPKFTSHIYSVNRDGPARLLKFCIKANVKNFIQISSCSIHGDNTNGPIIAENSPFKPFTHYAVSKAQAESLLSELSRNSGIRTIILRPGIFYGDNPSKTLMKLINLIKKNIAIAFGDETCHRMYVDIEKVIDSMLLAEKHGKNSEPYLIGDKNPITTAQLYNCIADELNVKLKISKLPIVLSRISEKTAFLAGKFNIHLALPTIVGEFGRNIHFSSEKAIKELSYRQHESPLSGIKSMVRSAIKNYS